VPGCRTTVQDGITGFLIPPQNATVLAEKMIWLINHPEQISIMGKASYEYCKQKFDVSVVNRQMFQVLRL
jgi:glycosyltransferase involved in cell wall biosynthesis